MEVSQGRPRLGGVVWGRRRVRVRVRLSEQGASLRSRGKIGCDKENSPHGFPFNMP